MKVLLQITLMILLISCSNGKSEEKVDIKQSKVNIQSEKQISTDTILERNSPDLLDMTRHQLFIDTTRNSKYFRQISDWKPNEFDKQGADYYFKEISETFDSKKVDLKEYSGDWISIHSLDNEYVAYNPINGIDRRYTLTDSSIVYYAIEADADLISKVVSLDKIELILELRTIPQKSKNQISYLRIKKTKIPYLYSIQNSESLDFDNAEYITLVTRIENLVEFNLVVSDAPRLVHSTVKFDKVDRKILE